MDATCRAIGGTVKEIHFLQRSCSGGQTRFCDLGERGRCTAKSMLDTGCPFDKDRRAPAALRHCERHGGRVEEGGTRCWGPDGGTYAYCRYGRVKCLPGDELRGGRCVTTLPGLPTGPRTRRGLLRRLARALRRRVAPRR